MISNLNGFNATVPVVITQISGEYEHINHNTSGLNMQKMVNTYLVELADENNMIKLALTQGLAYKTDFIHLNITGYRALGQRIFNKYMSILGKENKKPAFKVDNNIKDVVIQKELLIKPKNDLDQWKNLKLDCFASKDLTILCTGALTDTITLKFVKLGPIVIVSMDTYPFVADGTGAINVPNDSIPKELTTNTSYTFECETHKIEFLINGDFNITNANASASYVYTQGTLYNLSAFFCIYTTN
jgi:hypothetical protein